VIEKLKKLMPSIRPTRDKEGYLALCPFHNEKTPSLAIDKERELYCCFGCGKNGTLEELLSEMEKRVPES